MSTVPPSAASFRGAVDLSSLVRPSVPAASTPAAAEAKGASGLVVAATDSSFASILELSNSVPVIVELHAGQPTASLGTLVTSFGGRLVLATVDAS